MEDLAKYVGSQIKKLRIERNLTQEGLGKLLNVGKSTIANYETGYRSPKQDSLFMLASVLGVSIDDFFPTPKQPPREDIYYVYSHLEEKRQQAVFDFAKYQLETQRQEKMIPFPTSSKASEEEDTQIIVAAHMKDNLSEAEKAEVFDFINAAKQKELDKKLNR